MRSIYSSIINNYAGHDIFDSAQRRKSVISQGFLARNLTEKGFDKKNSIDPTSLKIKCPVRVLNPYYFLRFTVDIKLKP